jgi:hypothetical protein
MHSRRMTRLTNAFSMKVENHAAAMALHFLYYNFVRIHKTAHDACYGCRRDEAALGNERRCRRAGGLEGQRLSVSLRWWGRNARSAS